MSMEKLTTGVAYGASAGSILNGLLNSYSPEQWNAIGVLAGGADLFDQSVFQD